MTSYASPKGSPTLTLNRQKQMTVGTSSLFEINGPVAIHGFYAVVTTAIPAAAITFRLQHSSSLAGITWIGNDVETFFEPYAAGTYISFPSSLAGTGGFNTTFRSDVSEIMWFASPGTLKVVSNNATPANTWHILWTALHSTSSVVAL